ncbi:MAG: D-glycero-beta-D-manno-heptose 1,7-bisphosphate 7-phosphatase [Gammaproteobacteria bacterium]
MKLIILDRDGVINHESKEYIKTPEEWIPLPGSLEALAQLTKMQYNIAIATNQSGLGRGLFSQQMLNLIHQKLLTTVQEQGGNISAIFYCPHTPEDQCDCRKPKPGLLYQIADHFSISLTDVLFIGDSKRDIEAAQAAGCKPILVKTGFGEETLLDNPDILPKNQVFSDLRAVVDSL